MMFKSYRQKKKGSITKKRAIQFLRMFESVSNELNLYGNTRGHFDKIIALMGKTDTSTDMFLKTVLIIHSTGGLGISIIQRLSRENIENLNTFELGLVKDLLQSAFVPVTEMLENGGELSEEPFELYTSVRSYVSGEYMKKSKLNPTYHERLGKDYDLEENIGISKVNKVDFEPWQAPTQK